MIKNEKQYRITKAQVRRFQDAVTGVAGQARPSNISARLWEAQREAARSQMEELGEQVKPTSGSTPAAAKEWFSKASRTCPKP